MEFDLKALKNFKRRETRRVCAHTGRGRSQHEAPEGK